jgi:hypothetical protein
MGLLQGEFADLSAEAASRLLMSLAQDAGKRPPRPSKTSAKSGTTGNLQCTQLTMTAQSLPECVHILNQVVHIGALLVTDATALNLNDLVMVGLRLEPQQFSLDMLGRVVNISTRGTAIEIMRLEREDRAALERLYADAQAALAEQAAQSAGAGQATPPAAGGLTPAAPPALMPTDAAMLPLGRVGSTQEFRFTVRRQVDLPTPDNAVLTSSTLAQAQALLKAEEFYGPGPAWLAPTQEPERIEQLTSDRIIDILLQLSAHGHTGLLEWRPPGYSVQLFFDAGFVVEVARRPRLAREELGAMLLMANRVQHTQLAMAAAHAEEHQMPLERSLLALDILAVEPLRHAIAGRLTFLLHELCIVDRGEVAIWSDRALPAGFLPSPPLRVHVSPDRVIFGMLFERLRSLPARERERLMNAELDAYPEASEEEQDRIERAVTQEEHIRLVQRLLAGRRRLREIITESSMPGAETFAVIFALHRMGLVRHDRSLHHTVVRERFRENVTVKYLSVHKASYFEVLNVHWSSYDAIVEQAYRELCAQFDPATVPPQMEDEVHQRVREIRERIEAAWQALSKRDARHAYRTRIMPEYKLAHSIPLFLKQSELAERRGQWEEAADSLRRILEIEPAHTDAAARLKRVEQKLAASSSLSEQSSSIPR